MTAIELFREYLVLPIESKSARSVGNPYDISALADASQKAIFIDGYFLSAFIIISCMNRNRAVEELKTSWHTLCF